MKSLPNVKDRKLDWINPKDVDFGSRLRENYGDMGELTVDVRERGISTPVTVVAKAALTEKEIRELGGDGNEQPYILMAGGRRTKAALTAELPKIPAQIYHHKLTELELRIIELNENLLRKNFDFREEVAAKARIHDLMVGEFGEKNSTAKNAPGISQRDTARMIGVSPALMSQDINLYKAMQTNPEIAQASSKTEALKRYDELVRREAMAELARRQQAKKVVTDESKVKKEIADAYRVGNFFEGVKQVKDGIAHLVEIDPPYGIDLKKVKKEGSTTGYNEIDAQFYEQFMRATFKEAYRVMSDHSWLICWFGPDPWFDPIYQWITEAGFKVRRMPAVWTKRSGQTMQPQYNLANATEFFFYARKGDPGIQKQGRINVFEYAPVASKLKDHPTERPIELMEDLYKTFARPGANVIIPFLGSGNGILAAYKNDMTAFGWDLNGAYKDPFVVEVMTGPFKKWKSY